MLLGIWYFLLYMLLVGMACGWLAWVVLGKNKALKRPDRKPNWTIILGLGVAGSFIGGLAVSLLMGEGLALKPSGMIASFLGALVAVAVYTAMQNKK